MRISVIIPTLNRPSDLIVALESLARQTYLPAEVFIVDQSEDDATRLAVENVRAKHPTKKGLFIYLHQKEKSGARARNVGLDRVTGDVVSFLDDDSELNDDYYEKIVGYFEKNPDWGGIGGSLIQENMLRGAKSALRSVLWKLFLISDRDGRMTPSGFGYPIYERPIDKAIRVEMLHGCNMNFRTHAIGAIRFDPWFVGYSFREDAEFSYSISRKTQIWMVPDARLHHWESPKSRMDVERLKRMETRNYYFVFSKHKEKGWFSRFLFFYSLGGLLLIDLMEVVSRRNESKTKKFRAGLSEAWALLCAKKNKA